MSDVEKMMAKIAALLAKAESTTFPEEADALRAKAEELMGKYRIAEEELLRETTSSFAPVWKDVPLLDSDSEWASVVNSMFWNIAAHCGIRGSYEYVQVDGEWQMVGRVVGFEIDIRLAEMIFNAARLAFFARMEPKYDPRESAEENIFRLRGSGMKRELISKLVFGEVTHQNGLKVGRIYREQCALRGEVDAVSGRGFSPEIYRKSYADGFRSTLIRRLRNSRDGADAASGGALVLPEREARVDEAFYERYPRLRPETPEARAERKAREEADRAAFLANETPSQRAERLKRERALARKNQWRKSDEARVARFSGEAARRASGAGAAAARSVDLTRETPKARRTGAGADGKTLEG